MTVTMFDTTNKPSGLCQCDFHDCPNDTPSPVAFCESCMDMSDDPDANLALAEKYGPPCQWPENDYDDLTPRCECSTCDACPNPPDRSGTCDNCCDGQPEYGDPAGSHEPLTVNAALISAAPAMKQALLDLVNWYDMDEGDLRPLINAARVVIDAAEGLVAYNGGRVCYICGIENVDTTKARLGDVAGQVTAIADRIVNVCGVGKCDA